MTAAPDHDSYLAALPEPQRAALTALRLRLAALLPQAEEAMSYGLPAFKIGGRPVAGYSAAKGHLGFFPFSGAVMEGLADRLDGWTWSKGGLRFQPETPIPDDLLAALVAARLAELSG